MSFVPSTLRALADVIPPGTMDCVKKVGFSAETLYYRDVRIARPLFGPDTILRNSLGSTEAGLIARYDVPADEDGREGPVPVGTVDPDIEVRIVDDDDEPVPDGEVGRLVVVRYGRIALGYWNDPELTRRHFFTEPDGRRGFRTPDACRWRDDGLLEHIGRIDSRVKVHGAMVATSEVEVALISHPDIADAAVIAVPDEDGTRLVAYVVARDGVPLERVEASSRPVDHDSRARRYRARSSRSTCYPARCATRSIARRFRRRRRPSVRSRTESRWACDSGTWPRSSRRCWVTNASVSTTTSSSSAATRSVWSSCSR